MNGFVNPETKAPVSASGVHFSNGTPSPRGPYNVPDEATSYDSSGTYGSPGAVGRNIIVTIFDAEQNPRTIALMDFGKNEITFGRESSNDIVISSHLVSRHHGKFIFSGGKWQIVDVGSTNKFIHNNANITSLVLGDGDFVRIDDGVETIANGVLLVFSAASSPSRWESMEIGPRPVVTVGRHSACDIVLPHVSISKCHAKIVRQRDGFYIMDNNSTNGIIVNNRVISGKHKLREKDVIVITNSKLIFTSTTIFYCSYRNGIPVDALDIVIKRGKGKKSFITSNHVNLNIKPGELVAIIGGSGAGKSTILNCMCGYLRPTEGEVYINGVNLYQNFDSLKRLIGYVPQSDIVYDNLTLFDMLMYTAQLRLPKDTAKNERVAAIERAIELVELTEKKDSLIKSLSGGQKKRASIAVELLSDPNLLFLDEPASGLDPGTERNLMHSLRKMANGGKTVILVTHSTLQLKMCDKIVFMGKGGNLCFYGSYDEAMNFFGVDNIVDIYAPITDQAPLWRDRFESTRPPVAVSREARGKFENASKNMVEQLKILCTRYAKLVINDRQRLLLLLAQAPLLAWLISFVASDNPYNSYNMAKSLLFALSCSAFWVGMLNAIQEICKERTIIKREYMTGLSLTSYILSKLIVLGVMCLIQSFLITTVYSSTVRLPKGETLIFGPYMELLITTFLTALASAATGLFVSSLFTNADRAMTVAPILLMPQILFSGMIFELSGSAETLSIATVCRWSMEGYGTTADLNSLPRLVSAKAESYYEFTSGHLMGSWFILIVYTAVFVLLARAVLNKIGKE